MARLYQLLVWLGTLGLVTGMSAVLAHSPLLDKNLSAPPASSTEDLTSAAAHTIALPSETAVLSPVPEDITETRAYGISETASSSAETTPPAVEASTTTSEESAVSRTKNPYPFPQLSTTELNTVTRAALVNILCESGGGPVRATSGSGVIIDPRGIILTNAHVAQYFLLSNTPNIPISCVVRSGSPARAIWSARLLYLPSRWIEEHAQDILQEHAMGTGEHDYALLYITGTLDDSPLPTLPYLPVDTREAIGFTGDSVLVAAYPAEFIKSSSARDSLYVTSVIAQIGQLLTFSERLVDAISLGGTVVAQGGSSGGATVNPWGHLIGLLVTTSEGETTATRDLRAITMAHIDRSMLQHTGKDLRTFLQENPATLTENFAKNTAPTLAKALVHAVEQGSAH